MDIKTVRKQPQELLRGGGLIGVCTKILSLFCFFLKSYLISLKPDYTHKVMLYITRVSYYFFSGDFFYKPTSYHVSNVSNGFGTMLSENLTVGWCRGTFEATSIADG